MCHNYVVSKKYIQTNDVKKDQISMDDVYKEYRKHLHHVP
jgi:hypothetical protein